MSAEAKQRAVNDLNSIDSLIKGECPFEAAVALRRYQEVSTQAGTYNEDEYVRLGKEILELEDSQVSQK